MSYYSRVYRQRNTHTHDEGQKEQSFFSKQNDVNKSDKSNAFFQPKLTVNKPGDSYEKEADSVANAVVNKSSQTPIIQQKKISSIQRLSTPVEDEKLGTNDARMAKDKEIQEKPIQRAGIESEKEKPEGIQKKDEPKKEEDMNGIQKKDEPMKDEEMKGIQKKDEPMKEDEMKGIQKKDEPMKEEEDKSGTSSVQTKQDAGASGASAQVSSKIENSSGKGNALPPKTMSEMSSSFGVDFSSVRVHDDSESVSMNKELQAQAFTHGKDIYFNSGKYNPENSEGKFLLAHELTHVVQQNQGFNKTDNIQRTIGDANDLSSPRFKGDVDLEAVFDQEKVIKFGSKGAAVRKIQQALIDAGFPLPKFGADSIFGNETKTAVKEFQRQSGLDFSQQDGDVGPITLSRLDSRFTGASAKTVEQTCDSGIKTLTIDFAMMRGATGNPANDIAFANNVFRNCCIEFRIGTQVNIPDSLSNSLLGGDTDLLMADCGAVSSEDLITFLTATSLFGLTSSIIAFYVDTLHEGTTRLRGTSTSGLCATGPRAPMQGMIAISNGVETRTFSHELAHVLMNTFSDHRVTENNLQHVSPGAKGNNIAPVQCAIMYTRV